MSHVLLTGATGFLGVHLLASLLTEVSGVKRVTCIVRARTDEQAKERLLETGQFYKLNIDDPRVDALAVDSLSSASGAAAPWFELEDRVDAVLHCAAHVNWSFKYAALRTANVLFTQSLLQLCARDRAHMHFISTASVLHGIGVPTEKAELCGYIESAQIGGYARSKWVAERLVRRAAKELGIGATIYRPATIGASSVTGGANPEAYIHRLVSTCLQLGAVPEVGALGSQDFLPVDCCAAAVTAAMTWTVRGNATLAPPCSDDGVPTLHLSCDGFAGSAQRFFAGVSAGSPTPLPTVSWEQWYSSLTAAVQANQYTDPSSALALAPLFEFLNPGGLSSHRGMIHEASLAFYLALAADPALDTVTANRLALFTRDRLEPSWARQCAVFLRDVLEEERTDAATLKELMEAERLKDLSEL